MEMICLRSINKPSGKFKKRYNGRPWKSVGGTYTLYFKAQ